MVGSIGGSGDATSLSRYVTGGTANLRAPTAGSSTASGASQTSATGKPLTAADQVLIEKLKVRDADVKAHEGAHRAAAGAYGGSPSYTYQKGPDGANYAIGGEVSIDTSPIPKNPSATIAKEEQVMRAALAPADPSGQDVKVAAAAAAVIAQTIASKTSGTDTGTDQSGGQPGANGKSGGVTGAAATTATAAAAQNGGLNPQVSRGLAAYASAAGLASPASRVSVYA